MRHSCTLSGCKQPEKLIRQHLFPLSITDGEGERRAFVKIPRIFLALLRPGIEPDERVFKGVQFV